MQNPEQNRALNRRHSHAYYECRLREARDRYHQKKEQAAGMAEGGVVAVE